MFVEKALIGNQDGFEPENYHAIFKTFCPNNSILVLQVFYFLTNRHLYLVFLSEEKTIDFDELHF